MSLFSWLKRRQRKRILNNWAEEQTTRLTLLEQETLVKTAKVNLQLSEVQLKLLKREERRSRKKPHYIE